MENANDLDQYIIISNIESFSLVHCSALYESFVLIEKNRGCLVTPGRLFSYIR